jgi:hypothetical protein
MLFVANQTQCKMEPKASFSCEDLHDKRSIAMLTAK